MATICIIFLRLPSQKVSFPLQFPLDKHCLILDPSRLNPSSQANTTWCGNVVRLPNKEPFVGVRSPPQSLADG